MTIEHRPLADICDSIDYGYTASATDLPVGPKFLRITDIVNRNDIDWNTVPYVNADDRIREKYRLRTGDVVIARTGASTGAAGYISEPPDAVFASYLVRYRVKADVDSRYVYYSLKTEQFKHFIDAAASSKSAQPNASASTIAQFEVPLPSLSTQQAIAEILGALDDKIDLNRKVNATLDELARTIFRSWFVNFDPVRAKAEGREPFGMDEETAALFPDRFVESELGPIPEGWRVSSIGNEVKVLGGSTPSTKNPTFWEGGTHLWATPKDLSGLASPILIDTDRRITDAGVQQISSRQLPVGTVLLSSRAPVGYLALTTEPTSINQGFIAMVCDGSLTNYYVLNWARQSMDVIKGNAGGTTFAEISKTAFRPIKVLVPHSGVVGAFEEVVEPFYRMIEHNLRESRTLADLRDTLLPELISGRIRVPEAEKAVAGVV